MTLRQAIALMLSASMVTGCNFVIGDRVPNQPLTYITNQSQETIWVRMGEIDRGPLDEVEAGRRTSVCDVDSAMGQVLVLREDPDDSVPDDQDVLFTMQAANFCLSSWTWDGSELTLDESS